MCEVRKHALWYTKGLRGAAKLRHRFSTVSSFEELQTLADEIINQKE
jgi:tRNA-dihydrouridine synthase